jgi:hypothetical protein
MVAPRMGGPVLRTRSGLSKNPRRGGRGLTMSLRGLHHAFFHDLAAGDPIDPMEGAEDHRTCVPAGDPALRRPPTHLPGPYLRRATRHGPELAAEHSADEPTVRRRGSGCQV